MTIDRGITIRQPWASLIGLGVKAWETRSRPTSYRGPVMIHAARRPPTPGDIGASPYFVAHDGSGDLCTHGSVPDRYAPLPLGAVVAVADIVDCLPIKAPHDHAGRTPHIAPLMVVGSRITPSRRLGHFLGRSANDEPFWDVADITDQLPYGDWTAGRWAHQLANVRPLDKPVPCKGSPAYPWRADQATIDAVAEQLGGV